MAIDFGGALTTDNYSTGVLSKLNGTDTALAQMLDPAYVTYTGTPPTGSKRISSGIFQQYASGSWSELAMGYVKKAGDTGLTGVQVWTASGQAAPAFTTRSTGAKLVLYPSLGASAADYALGVTSSSQWYGVPTTSQSHQWYAGTTLLATLSGAGTLNATGLQVGGQNVWHSGNLTPSNYAPLASPALTGTPTAPTAAAGTNNTQVATTAFVQTAVAGGVPVGTIISTGSWTTPGGYLYCNGQAVSRTTFAALFAQIGTLWGAGDGSTTFNVPYLCGAFLRGTDGGRGLDPDSGRALGSFQGHMLGSHTHYDGSNGAFPGSSTGGGFAFVNQAGDGSGSTTSYTGGAETRPSNYAVNFFIKY